jgi:hypothetical protein
VQPGQQPTPRSQRRANEGGMDQTPSRGKIGAETAQGGTIARGGGHQWWVDGGRSVVLCFVTGVELGRAEAARVREGVGAEERGTSVLRCVVSLARQKGEGGGQGRQRRQIELNAGR